MHPLAGDLTQLSDEELLKKLNELYDKIKMSYYKADSNMSYQLRLLLEDYRTEHQRRLILEQEKFAKNHKKLADRIDIE